MFHACPISGLHMLLTSHFWLDSSSPRWYSTWYHLVEKCSSKYSFWHQEKHPKASHEPLARREISIKSVKFYLYGPSSPVQQFYPAIAIKTSLLRLSAVCPLVSNCESVVWTMEVHRYACLASFSEAASGSKVLRMELRLCQQMCNWRGLTKGHLRQ